MAERLAEVLAVLGEADLVATSKRPRTPTVEFTTRRPAAVPNTAGRPCSAPFSPFRNSPRLRKKFPTPFRTGSGTTRT